MITSSAVPPALQMHSHLPLYTLNARPRTDLLSCPPLNSQHTVLFNQSAPECSLSAPSLKQRSQSAAPYSCQVPKQESLSSPFLYVLYLSTVKKRLQGDFSKIHEKPLFTVNELFHSSISIIPFFSATIDSIRSSKIVQAKSFYLK